MIQEYHSRLRCNLLPDTTTDYYILSLEYILTVVQELFLVNSLEQVMEIVLLAARKIAKSSGATFVLLDHGFCYYADENAISPLWKGQRFPLSMCVSGWVLLNNQATFIPDIYSDERIVTNVYKHTFIKSMAMVPIGIQQPIAAIGVYWQENHESSAEMMALLQLLADMTMNSIENVKKYAEVKRQLSDRTTALENTNTILRKEIQAKKNLEVKISQISQTDDLTGLYNRRGFFLLAEQQLRLANRIQNNITIIFIEIIGLKEIYSDWGEDFGDDAIVATARLIKRSFRNTDTIARLEGGEFVILAHGSDPNFQSIRNRLKHIIDQFNYNQQYPFQLSVKLGFQVYDPTQNFPLDDLITLAQINIYTNSD